MRNIIILSLIFFVGCGESPEEVEQSASAPSNNHSNVTAVVEVSPLFRSWELTAVVTWFRTERKVLKEAEWGWGGPQEQEWIDAYSSTSDLDLSPAKYGNTGIKFQVNYSYEYNATLVCAQTLTISKELKTIIASETTLESWECLSDICSQNFSCFARITPGAYTYEVDDVMLKMCDSNQECGYFTASEE